MLRMILVAVLAGGLLVSLAAGAEPPDLSGLWKADLPKCDFGMESVPADLIYRVGQIGLALSVERVRQKGGKETKTARSFEARWDGTALLVEYHTTYQGYELQVSEKWSLSDDKTTMTVLRAVSASGGETGQRLVFHKEPPK